MGLIILITVIAGCVYFGSKLTDSSDVGPSGTAIGDHGARQPVGQHDPAGATRPVAHAHDNGSGKFNLPSAY